ncbi:hypothetical protein TREMEDRAFT_61320 [Tremella mesenterica DSM 1558]|uniref:uncharacterized protein n=1 Tax=Tremella mesenterica (strain ATCC 24925 / CBS 8224 / DSM 1558 / NBRC 9311 / NRRL Y-6157 / RJB 2259-6 / UBC 559-6) TaxID=578456 RepID=UPI0003F49BBC|nr:uncharacterized protein TREMEDRAFT_61320 [Tremella mesenterica DSM 1558]EIW70812.1 hypothetical protein TREMEDRAFT_61320 [Tremella mesenterica DSM 1558]
MRHGDRGKVSCGVRKRNRGSRRGHGNGKEVRLLHSRNQHGEGEYEEQSYDPLASVYRFILGIVKISHPEGGTIQDSDFDRDLGVDFDQYRVPRAGLERWLIGAPPETEEKELLTL